MQEPWCGETSLLGRDPCNLNHPFLSSIGRPQSPVSATFPKKENSSQPRTALSLVRTRNFGDVAAVALKSPDEDGESRSISPAAPFHAWVTFKRLSSLGQLKATGRFVKKWLSSASCLFSDYRTVYNSSFYTIRAPPTFIINDEIILSTTRTLRLPMGCVCLHCHFLDAIKKRGRAVFHLGNLQLG